ncbi:YfaP family protein [Lysinibacillus sp. NPDC093216]|uniref:YfaP family protein n=1 Tax=Lysinibacillus sp. NPDC093216 TaxID=3390576 RepID=UPI003CFCFD14
MKEIMNMTKKVYNNANDRYPEFEKNLKCYFEKSISGSKKLFRTNVHGLFDLYLDNLPVEARNHYNCSACKHFIERFGGLVTIDENGIIASAMWDEDNTPPFFKAAVSAIKSEVLNSKVIGVYIPSSIVLGQPRTGEWNHLSVEVHGEMVNSSRLKTAGQVMAEKLEEFKMLTNALLDYSFDTAQQAVLLLQSETLYRSDRVLGIAEWFESLHEKQNRTVNNNQKTNIIWLAVASAPAGFCHIRSSMIGTLLDDIASGMPVESVVRRFAEKMNPANYMRSQSAPTQNAILEAEKIVGKLGLTNSLQRRYATYEEIPFYLWENQSETKIAEPKKGVFSSIIPKEKTASRVSLPNTVMTWDKFQRTILPTAEIIEVLIDNPSRLMALVTASDETAPNILQWSNPFSWYYHGGIDGEIKRRVENAGGRYENNEIRASLIWEGYTDLDLHCVTPKGEHIYYGDKSDRSGGWLDIDMNGGGHRDNSPVENIRWSENAPVGHYRFYVHNYCERGNGSTPFKVELEVNGKTYSFIGIAGGEGYVTDVFEFDYAKGQQPNISNNSYSSDDSWGVQLNNFIRVNGITTSPNLWDEVQVPHSGSHIFFILDGVKDSSEGKGRGFFNETLKSELRQIRKTLEAYTATTAIEGADNATACGLGYSKDNEWNLTVKVTANNSTRIIKIDRWD